MPNTIPKVIHAIWLGSVLNEDGRKNLCNWKQTNSDYEVKLWIDSSTYDKHDAETLSEYENLKQWALDNNIIICDIAIDQTTENNNVIGKSELYQNMLSRQYYDDEIIGAHRNLAAASDLLRLEILYQEGGIYIDAKDIFPSQALPKDISAPHGFFCHIDTENAGINNDILASIKNGDFIRNLRANVHLNYQQLYQDESKLNAHRNAIFSSPKFYISGDSRKYSTMDLSGPVVLYKTLNETSNNELTYAFNQSYFSVPPEQAHSWYDTTSRSTIDNIAPIMRNFLREYFNEMLDNTISLIEKNIANQTFIKSIFSRTQHETLNLLIDFRKKLNALPLTITMDELYQLCTKEYTSDQQRRINTSCHHIIDKLKNNGQTLERLIQYFKDNNFNPKEIDDSLIDMAAMKARNPTATSSRDYAHFVSDVLNTENNQPNVSNLDKYVGSIFTRYKKK